MPTINEMKLRRGQCGTQAHQLLTKPGCTTAQRTEAELLLNEADGLTQQITLQERSDRLTGLNRTMPPAPPRPNPGAGNGDEDEPARNTPYKNAFEVYMRGGERALRDAERGLLMQGQRQFERNVVIIGGEKRDLTVGATGNYVVPQEFYNELIGAKKYIGALFGSVKHKTTPGNGAPMKIGFENDTANTIVVVAENTTVTESDPTLSGIIQSTDTLATLIKVSKQELADSGFDLNALFRDRLGKRFLRGVENFIANGDGANIASLVAGVTSFATTAAPAGPTFLDYVACQSLLDIAYEPNAAWYMSKPTRNYTMGLLDSLGRPLFLPNPQTGMLDQILGFPIRLTPYLPSGTTAGQLGVIYGDLEENYLLRTDGEMTIQRLDERYADQLMVGFLAYVRAGGNVTDAGTHPSVGLKTHA
jgi:HK97 family phage major capsid protein